ncbi:MAG TPA: MTH938/NDUFAF3 family protein [Candidatus Acidoferrales bacterium]|nr:MTH938/NDUFAF3 family protein [Candidatus Dormibacteraeota bacterium]HEX2710977.1 MTH938/NDUFAF3 family protein [Candidatus Acidoferrales bacterium]
MQIDSFSFGTIRIDGDVYEQDVVIDRGHVRRRKKKPSKQFRAEFGHTPLSVEEKIPWNCARLIIGTGAQGALPVMPAVLEEAERRGVQLTAVRTQKAIELLRNAGHETNAVLHITC